MNREIKFRIWDEQLKKFHYWGFIEDHFAGLTTNNYNLKSFNELEKQSQQYTGLKDKNGVEIYEGDLLGEKEKAEVKFEDGAFRVRGYVIGEWLGKIEMRQIDTSIIGNIYENLNLLK